MGKNLIFNAVVAQALASLKMGSSAVEEAVLNQINAKTYAEMVSLLHWRDLMILIVMMAIWMMGMVVAPLAQLKQVLHVQEAIK